MKKAGEISLAVGGIVAGIALIALSIDVLTDGAITRTAFPTTREVTEDE